jgi:hypothetical protein
MIPNTYAAFSGHTLLAAGPIEAVAVAAKGACDRGEAGVLVFDDATGQQLDLDLHGTDEEAIARLQHHPVLAKRLALDEKRSGPGRPKLGVVSREVSLLPRHWDWLAEQPGGASVTLRKLVEERMKAGEGRDRARKAHEAASKFMWTIGGNLPHFEEVSRAFTRREYDRLDTLIAAWPADVRDHARKLTEAARTAEKAADDDT